MMDSRRRSSTLRNEEICGGLANAHSTDARRGSDNVPHSFDREHKRSFIRKKGRRTDNRKEAEGKMDTKSEKTRLSCEWKLYTGEAPSSNGSGARLMLIDPEGKEYTYALRFEFKTTNNEAEYEALLAGLRIAQEMEIYLVSGLLPEDPKESKKVRVKALQYKLIRGSLYQRATLNGGWNYKVRILLAVNAQRCHKAENVVAKDDKGRTKEVTKKKEGKEVASIEEAYCQNKLRRKPAETLLAVVTNTSSSNFTTSSSNDLEYFLQSSPAVVLAILTMYW
ncbi:reverse transcriptase domain-containing protein [Tanacetum coccineum]